MKSKTFRLAPRRNEGHESDRAASEGLLEDVEAAYE
jgi:hypothetical protein